MKLKKEIILIFTCAFVLLLTGCTGGKYKKLDRSKVETSSTSIDERREYYEGMDSMIDDMSDEEYEKYCIKLNVEYINPDLSDTIMFLRNDDVYKGDLKTTEHHTKLAPGVYRVISLRLPKDQAVFGEIEILESGKTVTLTLDYDHSTLKLS